MEGKSLTLREFLSKIDEEVKKNPQLLDEDIAFISCYHEDDIHFAEEVFTKAFGKYDNPSLTVKTII